MAQSYDKYELDNDNGKAFRLALNDILEASATQNSGDDSPNTSNTSYPYQVWVDTDQDIVKIRDAATAGSWYSLYSVDSDGKPTGAVSYGSYTIATNDTAGNGGTPAITVDTSQNVGVGTTTPGALLEANGGNVRMVDTNGRIYLQNGNTTNGAKIGVRGTSDTTDGYLAFETNSVEFARLDSSGRLLVGTTTSSQYSSTTKSIQLTSNSSSNHPRIQLKGNGTSDLGAIDFGAGAQRNGVVQGQNGALYFYTNNGLGTSNVSLRMLLDGNGGMNVGEGNSIAWRYQTDSTSRGKIVVESTDAFKFYQGSSDTERFTINSLGYFYFNPTGTSGRLFLNTTNTNRSFGDASTGSASSTIYIGNAAIQVSSDERIKENIQDTQLDALAAVKQISVKDFTWNDPKDTSHNNRNARGTWTGVIAQELVEILPFVVNAPRKEDTLEIDHDSEEIWMLDQSQLCPVLIKAMQQQQAMIETLQAKVAALESA